MAKVIYDESGNILRSVSGKILSFNTPLLDGEFELEVDVLPQNIQDYKVVGGKLTVKSDSELQAIQDAIKLEYFRQKRNNLLQQSDWTQVPDAPVDQAAWATYRQQLRDLPENVDPLNPIWPTPPQ
jgi:hypothetical protein